MCSASIGRRWYFKIDMKHRDTETQRKTYFDSELTEQIIRCAIEVHRNLGPGLLESVYEECLCHEMLMHDLPFARQKFLPIQYKGINLDGRYRLDIVVADKVVIELKCIENILPVHEAQLMTYLRLSGIKTGLLLNFFTPVMKEGIRRIVY